MGRPTWLHAYDYIGGTSSGGLLAILVSDSKTLESTISSNLKRSAGNWAEDIREIIVKLLGSAFSTFRICRLICRGHLINQMVVDNLVKDNLTTQSFKHQPGKPHAMVIATRLDDKNDLVEHVIANYPSPMALNSSLQLNEYMDQVLVGRRYERSTGWTRFEACLATICAPIMSPPFIRQMRLPHESSIAPHRFHDGGLIRNMPAAHCVAEATKLWPGVPIGCVHSFGTGSGGHQKGAKKGTLSWLVALATPRNDEDERFAQLKALMPRLEELRQESQNLMTGVLNVDHPPPPPSMIRISVDGNLAERFKLNVYKPEDMEAMRGVTLQYVADNPVLFNQIIKDMLS
jgi:predicted acylesterase/phospholipase RssA